MEQTLEDYLRDDAYLTVDMAARTRIAKDIALGLFWLHHLKIIHRDLKLPNILVCFPVPKLSYTIGTRCKRLWKMCCLLCCVVLSWFEISCFKASIPFFFFFFFFFLSLSLSVSIYLCLYLCLFLSLSLYLWSLSPLIPYVCGVCVRVCVRVSVVVWLLTYICSLSCSLTPSLALSPSPSPLHRRFLDKVGNAQCCQAGRYVLLL